MFSAESVFIFFNVVYSIGDCQVNGGSPDGVQTQKSVYSICVAQTSYERFRHWYYTK